MNFLFVCTAAALRSPTARYVFRFYSFEAECAGTDIPKGSPSYLSTEKVLWADHISCMEKSQLARVANLLKNAPSSRLRMQSVWLLNLPDRFLRNDPILVEIFDELAQQWKAECIPREPDRLVRARMLLPS